MTERQLNMIQAAQDGIELARAELSGPGDHRARILSVVRENFLSDSYSQMSIGMAAYLACYVIAWRGIGSPDPYDDTVF